MQEEAQSKREPEWAESKSTLIFGVFLTLATMDNLYDTLFKGCPINLIAALGKGTFWDVFSVFIVCGLLFYSLRAIHRNTRKERPLRLAALLIHAFWSGSMLLYLCTLFAFYLDFFLTNWFKT